MSPFRDITCASIPAFCQDRLASVRAQKQIKAQCIGGTIWLIWPSSTKDVAELIYPLPGSELYQRQQQYWFAFRRQLPSFDVPDLTTARPLAELLFPASVSLPSLPGNPLQPIPLTLITDTTPRLATALECKLVDLHDWLDSVPNVRFSGLKALCKNISILILGKDLPPIAESQRFWGTRLLTPLGYRYDPFFPEATLLDILDLASKQLLLLRSTGMELIDQSHAKPLTRAAVRLALREGC